METVQPVTPARPKSAHLKSARRQSPPSLRDTLLAVGLLGCAMAPLASAQAETRTGYAVIEVDSGKVLLARDVRAPYIPASVAKLPAALVILDRLPAETRFTTRLLSSGSIDKKGVLQGDLVLVGGGDPSLVHEDLQQMAKALAQAGVKRVRGRFLYDGSAVPSLPAIEPRQPDDASYNPPLGGLAVDSSRFLVRWPKGKDGVTKAATGGEIPLAPAGLVDLPASFTSGDKWLPVKDPGLFAASVFAVYARQEKITLPTPQATPQTAPAGSGATTTLASHTSEPLPTLLRDGLYYSNNMMLETLALQATASATPAEAGGKINAAVQQMLPNVAWSKTSFVLHNASGLTDQSQMTPGQCAALTAHAATAAFHGVAVKPLLRGRKLDPFMADDPGASPLLRTKTGTMFYARALSGILTTASGKDLAFCIMSDDAEQRRLYDALPFDSRDDARYRDPAKTWLKAAREQEEALVKEWYGKF